MKTSAVARSTAEAIKYIKEKTLEDIGYLIHPARYKDELFEEYIIRRKLATKFIRARIKGRIFHVAKEDITKLKEAAIKAGIDLRKFPKIKGITYINPSPKTFKSDAKRKINN